MSNYNFPPFNDLSNNIYPIPDLININSIPIQQNQLNLPLNINQIVPNNQNQILPLLFPDQFLCQNQLYLLPRLLVVPQPNQMDYINQLIMEQNLRNSNNMMNINNINNINNIYNNLLNIQQLNNLNENILNNILNKSNEQNKEKEKTEISNTQQGKKFFITHEETNVEKLNKMKNDINTFN